jgi:hypothetical protein
MYRSCRRYQVRKYWKESTVVEEGKEKRRKEIQKEKNETRRTTR